MKPSNNIEYFYLYKHNKNIGNTQIYNDKNDELDMFLLNSGFQRVNSCIMAFAPFPYNVFKIFMFSLRDFVKQNIADIDFYYMMGHPGEILKPIDYIQ